MTAQEGFPESVQDELNQYVAQLTTLKTEIGALPASPAQQDILAEINNLIAACGEPKLGETLKAEALSQLADRFISVQDRSALLRQPVAAS